MVWKGVLVLEAEIAWRNHIHRNQKRYLFFEKALSVRQGRWESSTYFALQCLLKNHPLGVQRKVFKTAFHLETCSQSWFSPVFSAICWLMWWKDVVDLLSLFLLQAGLRTPITKSESHSPFCLWVGCKGGALLFVLMKGHERWEVMERLPTRLAFGEKDTATAVPVCQTAMSS